MKLCFIALDIDGVLNSGEDSNYIHYLLSIRATDAPKQLFHEPLDFLFKRDGNNFVNKAKLKFLNDCVDVLMGKGYQVCIIGISSWFINIDEEKYQFYRDFFNIPDTVELVFIKNTAGVAKQRMAQVEELVKYKSINSKGNVVLYLDYTRDANTPEIMQIAGCDAFIPIINGRVGIDSVYKKINEWIISLPNHDMI